MTFPDPLWVPAEWVLAEYDYFYQYDFNQLVEGYHFYYVDEEGEGGLKVEVRWNG